MGIVVNIRALVTLVKLRLKESGKFVADKLACLFVLPAVAFYYLARILFGPERAFPGLSQLFSLIPGITGAYLRRAIYRFVFQGCEPGVWISFGSVFSHSTCSLGRNAYIGMFCCLGDVALGDDVLVGSHVSIINGSGQHGTDDINRPIREQRGTWPRITIGQDSWIGDRALVMADVGKHCIIGAGAVVTKPIPDFAVAVGSPARVIRYRDNVSPTDRVGDAASAEKTQAQNIATVS